MLSLRMPNRAGRTHVEDVKDPEKILPPNSNLVLIALGEDESVDRTPFTLFDDLFLHFPHRSAIKSPMSRSLVVRHSLPHIASSPIASRTEWLS